MGTHRHRRRPCEDGGGPWSDVAISTEHLGHQKLEEARKNPPDRLWRERGPATTLTSNFWPPEMWENFCFFKPPGLGYSSHRKGMWPSGLRRRQGGQEHRRRGWEPSGGRVTQDLSTQGQDLDFVPVKWEYGRRSGKI